MIDRKVKMMDAGTALFTIDGGLGTALGQVKAEMAVYGKAYRAGELEKEDLPEMVEDWDLFLDYSTAWRNRYLVCKVDAVGMSDATGAGNPELGANRYAASFSEGNSSTRLRGVCLGALTIIFFICVFLPHFSFILRLAVSLRVNSIFICLADSERHRGFHC